LRGIGHDDIEFVLHLPDHGLQLIER
jgi:hypothetical protein